MTTSIDNVVHVTIGATPTFPKGKGFGLLNIVGNSANLPIAERIRFYDSLASVGVDFSSSDEEYKAAAIFFQQNPRPNEVAISRRFSSAVAAELLGGLGASQNMGDYTGITNAGFAITLDGVAKQVTVGSLAAVANMNALASLVNTALNTAAVGAGCVWTGKQFRIHSGTTGVTSTISFASPPSAGTDISNLMAIDAAGAGKIAGGAAAESVTNSLDNLVLIDSSWYGVTLTKSGITEQAIKDMAAWAKANVRFAGYSSAAANNLDSTSTASISYFLKSTANDRVLGMYSDLDDYGHVSAMARLFATDYTAANAVITLKFKQLPGIQTITVTETARKALEANHMNYYTMFGDSPMLAEGVMAEGTYADQVHALDWLKNNIETNVFGLLYTTPRVAQTDPGVARVVKKVDVSWEQAKNAGLVAPGVYVGDNFGTIKDGDFLPKGYYSYAPPVASQPAADRAARIAPTITTVGLGAGAIHGVAINVTFQP